MSTVKVLQRIPFRNFDYTSLMNCHGCELETMLELTSVFGSVNWLIRECEGYVDDNGMDKFVIMIACMQFLMERGEMLDYIAYEVKWDILDFETGNYDDLIAPEDLPVLKADIRKINEYLDQHPELIAGIEEDRKANKPRIILPKFP